MQRSLVLLAAALVGAGSAAADAPSLAELASSSYSGIEEHTITLVDGSWEGQPFVAGGASRPRVTLVSGFRLVGDLSGDGAEDAVVLLAESSGGSGNILYLAAMGRRDGEPINLGTALVGDRVQVRAGRVANGQVGLEVIQAGPNDAACCPSQLAIRRFNLRDGELTEEDAEIVGTLSLASLRGSDWQLLQFAHDDPAPSEPAITLSFTNDGITGSSGCNRYFGSPKAGDSPGDVAFGPLGGTRKACPEPAMQLEQRYLKALAAVIKFGFAAGKLSLTYRDGDGIATLLFAPRP